MRIVDNIYKLFGEEAERLRDDMRRRGLVVAGFSVPHTNHSPSPTPLEAYYSDPETLQIITDFFAVDFQAFGYEVELIPEAT